MSDQRSPITARLSRIGAIAIMGLSPALLTGCPVFVDTWEVSSTGSSSVRWGSPDVLVVGEDIGTWIDIDRPRYTEKKDTQAGINPIIQSYTANITEVKPGQPITFTVVAHDPDQQPLQYNWSATGGMLSGNTGQIVSWDPPERAGVYTISVIVSNARGGATTGALNLTVKGTAGTVAPTPVPTLAPTPVPVVPPAPTTEPIVTFTPTPSSSVRPSPLVAQQGVATIAGIVQDDSGPLADATVLLTSGDASVEFEVSAKTGADGKFEFKDVPAGIRLVLSARKDGYFEKLRTITALAATETRFDFSGTFALAKQ